MFSSYEADLNTFTGLGYDNSRATNPEFFAGVICFSVSHAERVFVYQGFPKDTDPVSKPDCENIAPFFINETFPDNWYRRGIPFSLPGAFRRCPVDVSVEL